MKKTLLVFTLMLSGITAFAGVPTSAIPNGGFESWTVKSYEYPTSFGFNSNLDNPRRFPSEVNPFNISKTTDAHHGSYALKLETKLMGGTDTLFAYSCNTNTEGDPQDWKGGHAISGKPTGVRLYYKYNVATGDSGLFIMTFTKAGVNVGMAVGLMGGTKTSFTLFEESFNLSDTPDSVAVAFASSNAMNESVAVPGATLIVDSITFLGIANQPALFNGDFENWTNGSVDIVNNWHAEDEGVTRTTDKYVGSYAIELKTRLGERQGQQRANAATISTGYYPNNCNGNCTQQGGYPYTQIKDTLCFYYKYAPSSADSAEYRLHFKKLGTQFSSEGNYLLAASNWTKKEVPFDMTYFGMGMVPDSVVVEFQSSKWSDSTLNFVGSTLIIDEVYFKSERPTTGFFSPKKNTNFSITPNPASDAVKLNLDEAVEVKIMNLAGQTVKATYLPSNELLDVSDLANGNYLLQINSKKYSGTQNLFIKR